MTESTQTPAGVPDTAATGGPHAPRFRRSRRDRMLAGVCGGVGEALRVDPVVIRVAVVVLTFFGGAGVVAYIACWLLLPDGEDASPVRRALGRRGGEAWTGIALVGLLALAVVITLDSLVGGWGPGHNRGPFPLLVLVALFAVGYALLKRRDNESPDPIATATLGQDRVDLDETDSTQPAATTTATTTPTAWADAPPPTGWNTAPSAPPTPQAVPPSPPAPSILASPEVPPPPPEPRSMLGLATLSLVLIALGVLAVAAALGLDVPPPAYPAVVLAGSGVGLLVGARYGRGRGLIALGVVGLVALAPTTVAGEFEGEWVADGTPILPTAGTVEAEYRYRTGQLVVDLSTLDASAPRATEVSLGVGEIRILVPAAMDVVLDARLRVGELEVFGQSSDGFDNRRTVRDDGPDGPGGGTLNLTVRQGVGHLEVVRVPSDADPQPADPQPADPQSSNPEVSDAAA